MPERLPVFQIKVQPSPETNDHEVCLFADGKNLIEYFEKEMMGMDPDDLLVEPSPLHAYTEPHKAIIARCYCGVTGCGNVPVHINRDEAVVTWTGIYSDVTGCFAPEQYEAEVERAVHDFSWETPDRTAARQIRNAIDKDLLARNCLRFEGASDKAHSSTMTVSLEQRPGPYQLLLHLPWDGKDVDDIVARFKLLLASDPESWPTVERLGPLHHYER